MSDKVKVVVLLLMVVAAAAYMKLRHAHGPAYEENPRYQDPDFKVSEDHAR